MHPAASSVSCMFVQTDDGLGSRIDSGHDARVIASLLERHRAAFRELLMAAYNPVILTLRVLNHFGQFPVTPRVAEMDFSSIPVWERIAAALNS